MKRIQYNWPMPKEIDARLGSESWGAQRAIFEAGHLLLILHAPPKAESNVREHEVLLRLPDGKWMYKGLDRGERALLKVVDDYAARYAELETRFDKAKSVEVLFGIIDSLLPLVRASANMQLALQSAREHLGSDLYIIDLRDRAVDIARGFELLLADARLALEFRLARSAEEQTRAAEAGNRAQNRLNVLAAVAFPLMSISAVFGMNLHSGLEDIHVAGFWLVFAGGLGLGFLVKGWMSAATPHADEKPDPKSRPLPGKR